MSSMDACSPMNALRLGKMSAENSVVSRGFRYRGKAPSETKTKDMCAYTFRRCSVLQERVGVCEIAREGAVSGFASGVLDM